MGISKFESRFQNCLLLKSSMPSLFCDSCDWIRAVRRNEVMIANLSFFLSFYNYMFVWGGRLTDKIRIGGRNMKGPVCLWLYQLSLLRNYFFLSCCCRLSLSSNKRLHFWFDLIEFTASTVRQRRQEICK